MQSEASELREASVGGSSASRVLPALASGPTVTARVRRGPMNPGVLLKVAQWILGSGGRVCDFSDKLHFPYTAVIIFLFVTVRTPVQFSPVQSNSVLFSLRALSPSESRSDLI